MAVTFRIGGIHPKGRKISASCPIEELPLPSKVYILMNQHFGAPATPIVAKGDRVLVGQKIAQANGFMSANIFSPVSGVVSNIVPTKDSIGKMCDSIVIDVEGDEWCETIDRSTEIKREIDMAPEQMLERIREMGIVGLGGAMFPTAVKLSPKTKKESFALLLNGTECEPYLTSDYRMMLEHTEEILIGGEIMRRILGFKNAIIGVELNKPEAVSKMKKMAASYPNWKVVALKKKYPQGGEKQLINAILKKEVPPMGLPIDAGAVVQNVSTAFAVYEAVQKNKPLIDNVITVTGENPTKQKNYKVRVGTPMRNLIDAVGGLDDDIVKVVSGGPMMGKAVLNLDAPTIKGTSCLLMLTAKQTKREEPGTCVRCGRCLDACPMGLEPYLLFKLHRKNMMESMESRNIQDCLECGCCQYVCPSHLPLLDRISLGKAAVLKVIRSRKK